VRISFKFAKRKKRKQLLGKAKRKVDPEPEHPVLEQSIAQGSREPNFF
jgi:hypothetical protein